MGGATRPQSHDAGTDRPRLLALPLPDLATDLTEGIQVQTENAELVADPVGHISISGVHGRDELNERLAKAPSYRNGNGHGSLKPLLVGVAIGAAIVAILRR